MTLMEWFLAGGPWMWAVLGLTGLGISASFAVVALLVFQSPRTMTLRKVAGVSLIVVAALCLASGFTGYSNGKQKATAFAEANDITDPDFFETFEKEARIPLQTAAPVAVVFGILGLLTALRKPSRPVEPQSV
ncbi:MAG: hypothetical protein GY719_07585 [bacterium]|nr:hypothetical protein [bacterium]